MSSLPDIPTLTDILLSIELADGSNLNKKEVEKLIKIKKEKGKPLFSIKKNDLILNTISMIDKMGFEKTYNYLKEVKDINDRDIIKNSSLFVEYRRNNYMELTKDMIIKEINQSPFKCPRCGEKNVSYNVFQARSSDEGATEDFLCNVCGHRWRN